jgi:hypothetical protein
VENVVLVGFLLGVIALVGIAAWVVFGPRRKEGVVKRAPVTAEAVLDAIEDEDGEEPVEVRLERLERSLRMLVGRVNKLSPPREGTGKQGNGKEPAPAPAIDVEPVSRAQLYADALKRRRNAG